MALASYHIAEMGVYNVKIVGRTPIIMDLTLFVANGVTTMRGMLGRPSHLALRQQLASGEKFGPRLITSGPSLNGNSVRSPADGEEKVRAQHAAGRALRAIP